MEQFEANTKLARLDARVPFHIKEDIATAAALSGRSQTDFVIAAVSEAARRVIAEHSVIRLCLDDQKALAEALCGAKGDDGNGSERFGRLRQALDDHGRQVESR